MTAAPTLQELPELLHELGGVGVLPGLARPGQEIEDALVGQLMRAAHAANFEVSVWHARPNGTDTGVTVAWATDPRRPVTTRFTVTSLGKQHPGASLATLLAGALLAAARKRGGS